MNSKAYLVLLAVLCVITVVSGQSSTNPIASLESKASSIAASATNTSPSAPTSTSTGMSLASNVIMQLTLVAFAFIASTYFA